MTLAQQQKVEEQVAALEKLIGCRQKHRRLQETLCKELQQLAETSATQLQACTQLLQRDSDRLKDLQSRLSTVPDVPGNSLDADVRLSHSSFSRAITTPICRQCLVALACAWNMRCMQLFCYRHAATRALLQPDHCHDNIIPLQWNQDTPACVPTLCEACCTLCVGRHTFTAAFARHTMQCLRGACRSSTAPIRRVCKELQHCLTTVAAVFGLGSPSLQSQCHCAAGELIEHYSPLSRVICPGPLTIPLMRCELCPPTPGTFVQTCLWTPTCSSVQPIWTGPLMCCHGKQHTFAVSWTSTEHDVMVSRRSFIYIVVSSCDPSSTVHIMLSPKSGSHAGGPQRTKFSCGGYPAIRTRPHERLSCSNHTPRQPAHGSSVQHRHSIHALRPGATQRHSCCFHPGARRAL